MIPDGRKGVAALLIACHAKLGQLLGKKFQDLGIFFVKVSVQETLEIGAPLFQGGSVLSFQYGKILAQGAEKLQKFA